MSGEIKAKHITKVFFSLPPSARRKVLSTLKHVRVNITDPRPYQADIKAMLGRIIPGVDAEEFLQRLEQAQKLVAEDIRRMTRQFAARRMLWDSPSERLRFRQRALTWTPIWPPGSKTGRKEPSAGLKDIDIDVFEEGDKPINLNTVSVFVSKSGSVLFPALDALDRACEHLQWPATAGSFGSVGCVLREFHLFDDGNEKAIAWVNDKRNEALSLMDQYSHLGLNPKPLQGIDSRDSYFIQAADIAAGIVTELWERWTLVEVVRSFDYVTYNGKRISEMDAVFITTNLNRASNN